MGNKKWKLYDWDALKLEYFEAPDYYAGTFLQKKLNVEILNWYIRDNIKGWVEEKLAIKDKALKIAENNIAKKLWKIYTPSEQELSQWYEAVMGIFRAKALSNYQKIKKLKDWTIIIPPDVTNADNKILWEVFKTERGEPTKVLDREDYVPPTDEEDEDVVFYLPDNWRDNLEVWKE